MIEALDKPKKHDLVFEVTITSPKSRFPFITLTNLYLIVGVCEILLGEPLSFAKLIKKFSDEK